MRRILVWALEILIPGVMGGLGGFILTVLVFGVSDDSAKAWPAVTLWALGNAVWTFLFFRVVAILLLRQDGWLRGLLGGALIGAIVQGLFTLISTSRSFDWGNLWFLPLFLPALGATIGYNMQQPADGEQAKVS